MTPEQTAEHLLAAIVDLQARVAFTEELLKKCRSPVYVVTPVEQSSPDLFKLGPGVGSTPLNVVYYDVATPGAWVPIQEAVPFTFKRKYANGQSVIENGQTWIVLNSWIIGSVYRVLCSRTIPGWMADEMCAMQKASP